MIASPKSIEPWWIENKPARIVLVLWLSCGLRNAPCDSPMKPNQASCSYHAATKLISPRIAPILSRSDGDRASYAASAPARSRVRRNARSPRWAGAASDRHCESRRLPPHRSRAPIPRLMAISRNSWPSWSDMDQAVHDVMDILQLGPRAGRARGRSSGNFVIGLTRDQHRAIHRRLSALPGRRMRCQSVPHLHIHHLG